MDGKGSSNTIFGFGINDVESVTQKEYRSNGKRVVLWRCPYYTTWHSIVRRSYSPVFHKNAPTYKGCTVSEEWRYFSNFKLWMEGQNWQGMQLDKDILFVGNKVYSAETCVFVTRQVNNFLTESGKSRGEWPIGVCKTPSGKYFAYCGNPFTGKREHLGSFTCPIEANAAWLSKKLEHAYALAAIQTDHRVAVALIERYENYTIEIGEM